MGRNKRPVTTITRSISFDNDVFLLMEERRKELRASRSDFLRMLLEDTLGVLSHPEVRDTNRVAKRPKEPRNTS